MFVHGFVPDEFNFVCITPVPKNKSGNLSNSDNYRAIALSSVFGKVLDLIIMKRYNKLLNTSELQFGFKSKRSTGMCTMVLKEVIDYYVSNGSTVYCTMLDATKAFDRVDYGKLFGLLIERKLPPVVIRLLLCVYVNCVAAVRWNGSISAKFLVKNGVRQGGILSPLLFCVYFDDLLCMLEQSGVGCYMGSMFLGSLAYADDVSLVSPSQNAMHCMLNVCEHYAKLYNIKFNATKSKCIVFKGRRLRSWYTTTSAVDPQFFIAGNLIEVVTQWPHLGHIISGDTDDGSDIIRGRETLIKQLNDVICYFDKLDIMTKIKLLKIFCLNLYGCELWRPDHDFIDKLCVALRQGLRRIWRVPRDTHCNILMAISECQNLTDIICKRQCCFIQSCVQSNSPVVSFVVKYGINYGQMFSSIGYSSRYCCKQFSLDMHCFWTRFDFTEYFRNWSRQHVLESVVVDAKLLNELIMLRDSVLWHPFLTIDEILHLIHWLCTG